jgi:hypothetical protein
VARHRLLRLRCTSECLSTLHGSSRGSSSTTSPTLRVRVPLHVSWLVVDYFAYAACPGASAPRAARRRLLRLRRASGCLGTSSGSSRRSLSTTSPTSRVRVPQHVARLVTWLVVDYFAYVARLGASAHDAARHVAHRRLLRLRRASECLGTSRGSSRRSSSTTSPTPRVWVPRHVTRLVIDYFASRGSSSTTSRTTRVRVPRHLARLVTWLVVDYCTYAAC